MRMLIRAALPLPPARGTLPGAEIVTVPDVLWDVHATARPTIAVADRQIAVGLRWRRLATNRFSFSCDRHKECHE